MRTRPWPLVILALIQILTPLFNILFNSWTLQVKPYYVINWVLQGTWLQIFEFFLLMPIAGFAIYRMKKWSYLVFLGAMVWGMVSNLQHLQHASGSYSTSTLLWVYGLEIALVTYFLLPAVRTTYFDPSVRWWESKPRYELKLTASFLTIEGTVLNISEGGAFVVLPKPVRVGEVGELKFSILSQLFTIQGKVVHSRDTANGVCYGVQFIHTPESAKRFSGLVRGLKELGFRDRVEALSWARGFGNWIVTLLKTGKGLVPELKFRNKT